MLKIKEESLNRWVLDFSFRTATKGARIDKEENILEILGSISNAIFK